MKQDFVYDFKVIRKTEEKVSIKATSLEEAKDKLWQSAAGKYKTPGETIDVICERFLPDDAA